MGSFDAYEKRFRGRNKENIESAYKTKVNIRFQNRGGGNYKKSRNVLSSMQQKQSCYKGLLI